jgi:hypothetical protein
MHHGIKDRQAPGKAWQPERKQPVDPFLCIVELLVTGSVEQLALRCAAANLSVCAALVHTGLPHQWTSRDPIR